MTLPVLPEVETILANSAQVLRDVVLPDLTDEWPRNCARVIAGALDYAIGLLKEDRAAEYRAEAERQDNEVYELRYPKREVANDPWGLPDMGGVSDSCSFSGCTVEEEVQRAQRWFDRRDYDDIGEWNRVEEAGHTPDSLARFVRTQYNGDPMYAAAFTVPDEGANDGAIGLWSLLFSVLATAAVFLVLSARRPQ